MYTDRSVIDIYFSDLNVPIAYIILTVAVVIICWKRLPKILTFFLWVFSGWGIATLFDAIYDYQIKIFVWHTMSLEEGLIFLMFPIPTYAFIIYIWKFGEKKRLLFLIPPVIAEILLITTFQDFSAFLRYFYVLNFIFIILGIKKYEKKNK